MRRATGAEEDASEGYLQEGTPRRCARLGMDQEDVCSVKRNKKDVCSDKIEQLQKGVRERRPCNRPRGRLTERKHGEGVLEMEHTERGV